MIGRLVEAWCMERGVEVTPYGSWTLENKEAQAAGSGHRGGLDLGGIDKLEIYRELSVGEVWFWENDAIRLFALRDGRYEAIETSEVLVGIDLPHLLGFLDTTPMTRAVREYRASLRA